MSTKSKGTSAAQKLASLAKKTGVQYEHLATEFLIERLLARFIGNKDLHKSLVFKGGFVGLRVYDSKRYAIDLDALLLKSNIKGTLEKTRAAAETDLDDGVWFRFEQQVDLKAQGEYGGIRQSYRAGFGEVLKKLLRESLQKCFTYRETDLPRRLSDTLKELNTKVLERGWASAVASVKSAPKFSPTFEKLISLLEDFDT